MNLQASKPYVVLALTGAIASFLVVGQLMRISRAIPAAMVPVTSPRVADGGRTFMPQASVPMVPRLDARSPDRQAGPRGACREDVRQLCRDVTPGQGRIVRCLAEHQIEVSESCRSAMLERRMERQQRQAMWRSQIHDRQLGQARREHRMQRRQSLPHEQSSLVDD